MGKKKIPGLLSLIMVFSCLNLFSQGYGTGSAAPGKEEFRWPGGKSMALSLTFDDARFSQVEKGIPLLDKYGVNATFYVSPENFRKYTKQWKKASEQGHDIGNHTLTHPCSGNFPWSRHKALEDYTLEQMKNELDSAGRIIERITGRHPSSFAYPCGQTYIGSGMSNQSYAPLIAAMFSTGRSWLDEAPNDPSYCDLARLNGMELDGKSFSEIKILIDQTKKEGAWLVLAGHEMDEGGRQTSLLSTIDSICEYASDPANGIWIEDVDAVAAYVREKRGMPAFEPAPDYLNPALPVEERVDILLSEMTLKEKIGQLNMPCGYFSELGNSTEEKMRGSEAFTRGELSDDFGPAGGFFTLANNVLFEGPVQQSNYFNNLQKIALEETRLGIPLLQTEEGTHGLMCSGGTIFPEGPALGSTWNMELIDRVYSTTAMEARAVGIHQLFTLVIEPIRDPRLGRNQEAYSEDPYLTSRISETIVNAVQGEDISQPGKAVAGLCHYPGQSQPVSGLERGAMEISERTLREIFLPPWEAGIKNTGALGVMATYPTIDGVPIHSSGKYLTDVLRGELGFEGLVLSEGNGVNTLVYTGIASTEKEAAAIAANAGMDVSISFSQGYGSEMEENVREGRVSMETIDRSVKRVLRLKYELGLFDDPFTDPEKAAETVHHVKSRELALEAAREGIVLLRNENDLLPLSKNIRSIAVIGPNADDEKNQLGDYTSKVVLQEIETVLDGITALAGDDAEIHYVKGCNVTGTDLDEIDEAVNIAAESDVAIVVLGENEWQKEGKLGTSGEGYDVATLELTGLQKQLIKGIHSTGKPVVVVLINGRSLAIPWIAENVPAVIEAWLPGEKGGKAVAEIIFGDFNPCGKLPVTFPRHVGQLPVYYNYKPSKSYWLEKGWGNSYADMEKWPLYEFGFGMSYTEFKYANLIIDPDKTWIHGSFNVTADITNTGKLEGKEVVQLYIRDRISSVVRPVKELKGFTKVSLGPGETKEVGFELGFEELKMLDREMNWVVEPGEFEIMIGASSEDIRLVGRLVVE
ncbi:MAG: glycoside hydrolase family 3 C-terminal domain-containing protein [Bacteroidales bacterium]|nr:glycoside hydrolase family 3 C-terminal domain-containing protein [Bacteroidales bacterium]